MIICHEIKCTDNHYGAVEDGSKPFEMRINDRDYNVGHQLWIREVAIESNNRIVYTGRSCVKAITYLLDTQGFHAVPFGWVILGLKQVLQ